MDPSWIVAHYHRRQPQQWTQEEKELQERQVRREPAQISNGRVELSFIRWVNVHVDDTSGVKGECKRFWLPAEAWASLVGDGSPLHDST